MSFREKIPFYDKLVLPYHFGQAVVFGVLRGFPGRKLTVVGVTGTNGKTTTCFMIWKMLNAAGRRAGVMTTVGWGVDEIESQVEHMTTVDSKTLNERISTIVASGAEYLVLELTSHAMAQFRAVGVPVDIAVLTNVTHEHLDYHGTFEKYRDAKRKLFKKAKFGVVNADDKSFALFAEEVAESVLYGISAGDLRAEKLRLRGSGVEYEIPSLEMKVRTRIPGKFNVYNSLAAVAVGRRIGLTDKEIVDGIYALTEVEGRMTRIDEGQDFEVIVDFAHTPDAIEKVFESLEGVKGRIIAVHGAAGRRDATTRAMRGEILGRCADIVIVTEDDSRDEDPAAIAEQVVSGVVSAGKKLDREVFVELDRKKAVVLALEKARKGDVVLFLGKGHEKTLLVAEGAVEYYEPEVVRGALRKALKKKS